MIPPSFLEVLQLLVELPAIDLALDFIVDVNTNVAKQLKETKTKGG